MTEPQWRRRSLREIAERLGEQPGIEVVGSTFNPDPVPPPPARKAATRRNYTARELREMAQNAENGIPPATSPARAMIREAQECGDFERANALTREVKEKAPDLYRLARAAEKAERRAKRRRST